jgi:hypothetical protein
LRGKTTQTGMLWTAAAILVDDTAIWSLLAHGPGYHKRDTAIDGLAYLARRRPTVAVGQSCR